MSLKFQISPSRVKIVTVMPCYDKKLEAVRPNFVISKSDETSTDEIKEVDTVLATHELVDLISGIAEKQGQQYTLDTFSTISLFEWKEEEIKVDGYPE
jgi:iron only hydrogenase large subunit-like protein